MENSRKKPLPDLLARVEACLARQLSTARPTRFCVGLSGGLDSVVLLHLAATFCSRASIPLSAIHVHHGLSAQADAWANFAMQAASALGVPCLVEQVDVNQHAELGLEAAARRVRYAVFERQACDVLLLAHHQNDQAETVLLNLLRGSGVRGLAAMPEVRALTADIQLLRPLLDIPRSDLLEYALAHQLEWVEDESNQDQNIDRNFLRHAVIPQIATLFPGATATLARSTQHLAEANTLLEEIAREDGSQCIAGDTFDLALAANWSAARLRNVLRYWLAQTGVVPDARAFDELLRVMLTAKEGAMPIWLWRQQAVRRYRTRLYRTPATLEVGANREFLWQAGSSTSVDSWAGTLVWQQSADSGIAERYLAGKLELRPRSGGESLRLRAGGSSRSLKHLWQWAGVPPWQRDSTPLLWIEGRLAAAPGVGLAAEFCEPGGWLVAWQATSAA